jgi:DNA-binding transcriptional ArsR family regulator
MSDDDGTAVSSLRAVAHPVRLRILSLLTGSAMSAAEIARELDLTHANASYHLRVLAEAGEVEVAGEEKIRGGVAKRYRHPWDRVRDTQQAPAGEEDRELYVRALGEELVRRFRQRRARTRSWLTDAEMWVAPEVWDEVVGHLQEASRLMHAEAQPPRTRGTLHVNLTAALFEMRKR